MKSIDELKAVLTAQVAADFADPDGRRALDDRAYLIYLERSDFYQDHNCDEGDIDTLRKLIDTLDVDSNGEARFADAAAEPPVE